MINLKKLENVEYLIIRVCVRKMIKDIHMIKSRIDMGKAALNRRKTLFTRKLELILKKETSEVLHLEKKALCGAETWAFLKADQKYFKSFEMWCQRRMEKIS
jgi:hypothetical protein